MLKVKKKNKEAEFKTRDGTFDEDCIREIWQKDTYMRGELSLLKNAVVIDVGAHIGGFSILAAVLGAKEVLAYEPYPDNFELLRKNIALNGLQSVIKPYEKAVVGIDRPLFMDDTIPFYKKRGVFNTGKMRTVPEGKIPVDTILISDIMEEVDFCDVLKMDIEGGEYEILYGLSSKLYDRIGMITLEFHSETDTLKKGKALLDHLEFRGFKGELFYARSKQGMIKVKNGKI